MGIEISSTRKGGKRGIVSFQWRPHAQFKTTKIETSNSDLDVKATSSGKTKRDKECPPPTPSNYIAEGHLLFSDIIQGSSETSRHT